MLRIGNYAIFKQSELAELPLGGVAMDMATELGGWTAILTALGAAALLTMLARLQLASLRRRLARAQCARLRSERALRQSQQQLCRLAASHAALRADERERIARDLHDDLGQHLLALSIQLAAARKAPEPRQQLSSIEQQLQHAIAALRAVIRGQQSPALRGGLQAALAQQMMLFRCMGGGLCRLQADSAAYGALADAARQALIYHVVQEALSNIVRHAGASEVDIALGLEPGALKLSVRDNGIGLPPGHGGRGSGLRGMQARVRAAGGQFSVLSEPGQGTLLSLRLPLGQPPALGIANGNPAQACGGSSMRPRPDSTMKTCHL